MRVRVLFCLTVGSLLLGASAHADSPSRDISQYVVVGLDNVLINNGAHVNSGNVGVQNGSGVLVLGRNVLFADGTQAVGGTSRLNVNASVDRLFANTFHLSDNAVVRTSQPTPFAAPLFAPFPSLPAFAPGGSDLTVPMAGSQSLAGGTDASPTARGDVLIMDGGTLTLTGGTYQVASIRLGHGARLAFSGKSTLNCQADLKLSTNAQISPAPGSGLHAPDLRINVGGGHVTFGNNETVAAEVFAPNALFNLGGPATLSGQFIGLTVHSDNGLVLNRDTPPGTTTTTMPGGSTTSTTHPAGSTTSTTHPAGTTTSTTHPAGTTTSTSTTPVTTTTVRPTCGNNRREPPEECDGPDFGPGGNSCTSAVGAFVRGGSAGGALVCRPDCTIDRSRCPTTTTTSTIATTTTTPVTTSTTMPHACGNNLREPPEECDGSDFGPGGNGCTSADGAFVRGGSAGGALVCRPDCTIDRSHCVTTTTVSPTTTTAPHSTTTTTIRDHCGDGVVEPGEQCDPVALGSPCGAHLTCGAAGTPVACKCVPQEICGNCIDDDGNGLTDFEDPACCSGTQSFQMTVRKGRMRPRHGTSKLRLQSLLAQAGLSSVNPLNQDVFVQIRPQGGTDIFCARVPQENFVKMRRVFKFWDHKHLVPSAQGLDDLAVRVKKDGSVVFKTLSGHAKFVTPANGQLQITVGFGSTTTAGNRCSLTTQPFRVGKGGALVFP